MPHCMNSKIKNIIQNFKKSAFFATCIGVGLFSISSAFAQSSNTSSPYSQYGIGEMKREVMPQFIGIGGLSTGIRYLGNYDNINTNNPASYSAISLTAMDAGLFSNINQLGNSSLTETSYNFGLSHVKFAFPLGAAGGLSIGLQPYSNLGYNYSIEGQVDTTGIKRVYAGEGGTSSAYIGYGVRIGKNFSVGANARYIFGSINHIRSIEYPNSIGSLNGKEEQNRFISGVSGDLGAQFYYPFSNQKFLIIGYTGTISSKLNSRADYLAIRTPTSVSDNTPDLPLDTINFEVGVDEKITMPFKHSIGFSLNHSNKWMFGADFHYATWDQFSIGNQNGNFKNSYGFAVGGQMVPDPTSVKYFNLVDYRLGFRYDRSHIHINNEAVNDMAVTLGFGLPLPSFFGNSFYKINLGTELGQRGKIAPGMVRERYVNVSLGFTLNDRWFRRPSYD